MYCFFIYRLFFPLIFSSFKPVIWSSPRIINHHLLFLYILFLNDLRHCMTETFTSIDNSQSKYPIHKFFLCSRLIFLIAHWVSPSISLKECTSNLSLSFPWNILLSCLHSYTERKMGSICTCLQVWKSIYHTYILLCACAFLGIGHKILAKAWFHHDSILVWEIDVDQTVTHINVV